MGDENPEKWIFVFSKDIQYKINDKITFLKYYKPIKNELQSLIFIKETFEKNNQLLIAIKQDHIGSCFYGNFIIPKPAFLIIQKIDPVYLIIDLIANYIKETRKEDEMIDIDSLLHFYQTILESKNIKSNESLNFIKKILLSNENKLQQICEVENIKIDEQTHIKFKFLKSKVFDFLNSKLCITQEQKNIEAQAFNDEERKIMEQEWYRERVHVLVPFLPMSLLTDYLNSKDIKFNKFEKIKEKEIIRNKQKNSNDNSQKSRKKKVKKESEPKELAINQPSITNFFTKK